MGSNGRAYSWLVVGSSPSAQMVDWVRMPAHRVIATSTAIERVPDCDVYVFKGRRSAKVHCDLIGKLLERGGTAVAPVGLCENCRPHPIPPWWSQVTFEYINPTTTFVRGHYGNSSMSGPMAVYWAINHGAREIDIVGFEGVVELQDGIPGGAYVEQARILRATAEGCPDVQFRFYGELTWEVEGANVEVIA